MKKIVNPKILALALMLCLSGESLAQQYVGIPRNQMNYVAAGQQRSQWCWAASIQMVFNYYGVALAQEDIVRRSYGSDPWGNLPDWPGSFQTITANLHNWGFDRRGQRYIVNTRVGMGAPPAGWLVQEMAQGHPVILAYSNGNGSGHAVVCTAVNFTNTYNGPIIHSIVVRDPWPSQQNRANLGRVEYGGAQLASVITAYWFVRVARG